MAGPRPRARVLIAAALTLICGGATLAVAQQEDFAALLKRLPQEKPQFAKRQQDMLAQRYDLSDRPAAGVTMTRGKPVQEGVRVKLPAGFSFSQLAGLPPH